MQTFNPKMDFLFAGAGASAILLLMSMEKHGLLKDKNILIIDPDTKDDNDKTYCFWSEKNKELSQQCRHLISHQWDEISVNRNQKESLNPKKYFHISGLDLYKELSRITEQYNLQRIYSSVLEIIANDKEVKVKTDTDIWEASMVFDSRPPKFLPLNGDDAHLLQSFIGYVIKTEESFLNLNCVDLMDFDVEQQSYTQFMYVLPLGAGKALVELTRFGVDPITQKEAEPILDKYITNRLGAYQILSKETGCIPMSTADIDVENIPGVIPIGGRAGAVKPSTGYAFKSIFKHAEKITECLKSNVSPVGIKKSPRFRFYDRLLLLILSRKPYQGKLIFETLFKKNKIKTVLEFLDEKTSLFQDLKIFLKLPVIPFLQAVGWVVSSRIQHMKTSLTLLILTLFLLFFYALAPHIFIRIQLIMFLAGMLLLGIPHGAVDHLLETRNLKSSIKKSFILKYLGLVFLNLALWLIFPSLALLFFIFYSAWHFGQTDLREWDSKNINRYKHLAWGSLIFGIILCGHVIETNNILENMHFWKIPLTEIDGDLVSITIAALAVVWSIFERSSKMFLSALTLAISIKLPLLSAFGLYFIGQHSINGWTHLKKGMNVNNISLFVKALPFTGGALVLLLSFFFLLKYDYISHVNDQLITIFFVFIACLSFPHVIAMNKFYDQGNY